MNFKAKSSETKIHFPTKSAQFSQTSIAQGIR